MNLPDEDLFQIPEQFHSPVHPWPGRDRLKLEDTIVDDLLSKVQEERARLTSRPPQVEGADELVRLGNAHLANDTELNSDQLAWLLNFFTEWKRTMGPLLLDYWAQRFSLAFCTEILLKCLLNPVPLPGDEGYTMSIRVGFVLPRMRELLASYDDKARQAAEEIAAQNFHPLCGYLFPERLDWVKSGLDYDGEGSQFMVQSVSQLDQARSCLKKFKTATPVYPIVKNLGPQGWRLLISKGEKFLSIIGSMPDDEALEYVFQKATGSPDAQLACQLAAEKFPCRSLRLCLGQEGRAWIACHALVMWPMAATKVRSQLSEHGSAHLDRLMSSFAEHPILPESGWPALLLDCPWLTTGVKKKISSKIAKMTFLSEVTEVRLLLRDHSFELPREAFNRFILLLAHKDKCGSKDSWIREILSELCPISCARLAWALFQAWLDDRQQKKFVWALQSLAWMGDRESLERLAGYVSNWPTDGHWGASRGMEVLAKTDAGLELLHQLHQGLKSKPLLKAGKSVLTDAAKTRGVSLEQLLASLIPTFEFDQQGRRSLDFGTQQFTLLLQPNLTVKVRRPDGETVNSLPEPGSDDDPEKARQATEACKDIEKELRKLKESLSKKFLRLLTTPNSWTFEEFQSHVDHPVVRKFAQGLIWSCRTRGKTSEFLLCENGEGQDISGNRFIPSETGKFSLVHPVNLSPEACQQWLEALREKGLRQPLLQLMRPAFKLTVIEKKQNMLLLRKLEALDHPGEFDIFHHGTLTQREWKKTWEDHSRLTKAAGPGLYVNFQGAGELPYWDSEEAYLWDRPHSIYITRVAEDPEAEFPDPQRKFGQVNSVVMSEILYDLTFIKTETRTPPRCLDV